jgi:FkbM family methyltransferase
VTALVTIATIADRLGLRQLVALGASLAYRDKGFEVDAGGHWVNRQQQATFVSPTLHTKSYSGIEASVLDNWTWDYRPVPGDTVIDVGAGIGEDTVVFSRLVGPAGRVFAIEAHPDTFACLQQTVARSGLSNVTAIHCALTDRDGKISISSHVDHVTNSIFEDGADIRVPARTLDSIDAELGIGEIALLKMNIEGAEKLAVRGFERLAPRVRHVVISCHDFVATHFGGGDYYFTKDEVRTALEASGFAVRQREDAELSWVRDYLYARR